MHAEEAGCKRNSKTPRKSLPSAFVKIKKKQASIDRCIEDTLKTSQKKLYIEARATRWPNYFP